MLVTGEVEANGLRFSYVAGGPADGPLALCLHGFPDHALTYRHLLPRLAEAGFRAVAPWMRGYHPTDVPRRGPFDLDTLAADANALHEALGGDEGAVLVGHDWGAFATYRAAAAEPDRWRRVVAMAVPPEPALAAAPRDLRQLRRSWYVIAFQLPGVERVIHTPGVSLIDRLWSAWSPDYEREPDDRERLREMFARADVRRATVAYYRALLRPFARGHFPDREAVPPQPTLYLHGLRDGCMGANFGDRARAVLPHADSDAVILAEAGHFLHLERPDRVNDLILDFVTST